MSNSQFKKNRYNQDYGIGTPSTPKETIVKFQRKQDQKGRGDLISREKKKSFQDKTLETSQICYINAQYDQHRTVKLTRTNSATTLYQQPKANSIDLRRSNPYRESLAKNNQEEKDPQKKKCRTQSINDFIVNPVIQNQQLKLQKISLLQEVKQLKQNLETRDRKINSLEMIIERKDLQIDELSKKVKNLISREQMLISNNQEQRQIIENYEKMFQEKEDEKNSVETRQDLEKMLSDMNRNFDEMGLDSKIQEQSAIIGEPRLEQVIVTLQEKIKYQEIEITMLKKNKYNFNKLQIEIEKLRIHNHHLNKKLKALSDRNLEEEQKKKILFDYSISFELSRDESRII